MHVVSCKIDESDHVDGDGDDVDDDDGDHDVEDLDVAYEGDDGNV